MPVCISDKGTQKYEYQHNSEDAADNVSEAYISKCLSLKCTGIDIIVVPGGRIACIYERHKTSDHLVKEDLYAIKSFSPVIIDEELCVSAGSSEVGHQELIEEVTLHVVRIQLAS